MINFIINEEIDCGGVEEADAGVRMGDLQSFRRQEIVHSRFNPSCSP